MIVCNPQIPNLFHGLHLYFWLRNTNLHKFVFVNKKYCADNFVFFDKKYTVNSSIFGLEILVSRKYVFVNKKYFANTTY